MSRPTAVRRQAIAPAPIPPALRSTALAALMACGALCVPAHNAWAQTAVTAEARSFQVGAGPLDSALLAFAGDSGVTISAPPALIEGRTTRGLQGRYPAAEGLQRLLAGTGLRAHAVAPGNFVLQALPAGAAGAAGEAALSEVKVVAAAAFAGAATEDTGRYTSAAALTTATPLGLTLQETPQSVSVMTRQRLDDQGLTTLQQTLAQVPGVKTHSLGTELNGANIRGYSVSNYQFDGVNTYVEVLGGGVVPASTLADMALYDRVEVLRGASGLVSGAGEPSGTINMVRKKPTAEFQGSVEAGIGSWSEKRGVLDLSGPLNEARSVRGRLIALGQDADSYIDHYGRNKALIYGVVEADLTRSTRLTAGVEHERTKVRGQGAYVGFPLWFGDGTRTDLPVSFSGASRDNWLELESTKLFATLEQELAGDWKLKLSANNGRSSHRDGRVFLQSSSGFANPAGDGLRLNASQRDGHIEQSAVDLNLRGPFTLWGRQHELVLGAAYENYTQPINSHNDTSGVIGTAANLFAWNRTGSGVYGPATVISNYAMEQKSVYGAARWQVSDKLKVITGARVFWQDYDFAERWTGGTYGTTSSEDAVFTPYGGLVYEIDKVHTAYASYSTIYKPQTVRDRQGAVLDPVEGANQEIGLKSAWLDGRLNTAIALYQLQQDNLAETDPGYTLPGNPDKAAYRSIKGARTRGLDLELFGALSPGWNVSASWTYSQTRNADRERINTTFPQHMVKLWTTYRLPGAWSRLTLGGGVNWQSKTYSTVNAWQINRDLYWEQKAYAVAGLMARYEFSERLTATLNVNNLLDKKYINSVSDWWYSGNYGAPRSVALNVKYRF